MKSKLSIAVIPPLDDEDDEAEDVMAEDESDDTSGERESFDEFADALESGDRDAAFEALKGLIEQCCYRCMGEGTEDESIESEEL